MNTGIRSRYSVPVLFRLALVAAGLYTCPSIGRAANVEIIAHRGGYLLDPENTCAAFSACSGLADRVEFDVRFSSDGQLVIMHDDTVDRTTDGHGVVSNLTLAEITNLDAGVKFSPVFAGVRVPTFVEALRSLPPGVPALVDCKSSWTNAPQAILDTLRAENAMSNVIFACGGWDFLVAMHNLDPDIALCALGSNASVGGVLTPGKLDFLKRNGVLTVAWDKIDVTQEIVDLVHSNGMRIFVYSPDSAELRTFVDMGVDGLYVDQPGLAKQLIRGTPSASNAEFSRGLAAYWKFDDGLSNSVSTNADDVENLNPGSLFGFDAQPSWISGDEARINGALRLDGANDNVRVPSGEPLNIGTNAVTFSVWVKLSVLPSALPTEYAFIYGSDLDSYVVYLDRGYKELRFKTTDGSINAARPGIREANLRTGVWHHVVGVFDGSAGLSAGQALIYLDGQLQDVHTGSDPTPGRGLTNVVRRGQTAAFGRKGTPGGYYFAGAVDDAAIWRRALSPADVRQIYEAGTNGIPLEKKTMTIWITNVYPVFGDSTNSSDMGVDIRVEHGSLTNQTLRLRSAVLATEPYADQAVLEGGRNHAATFRVPASSLSRNSPSDIRKPSRPNFFQIVCP